MNDTDLSTTTTVPTPSPVQYSLTTASVDLHKESTAWKRMREVVALDSSSPTQFARIFATCGASSGEAKGAIALVHSERGVIGYYPFRVTGTARKANPDGVTGSEYVGIVSFDCNGLDTIDLYGQIARLTKGGDVSWWIGAEDLGSLDHLNVYAITGTQL